MTGALPPKVDVVVVSWNTRDLLDRCLRSLLRPAESGVAHVTVVDNGSTDGSREMVRSRHAWAELIEPGENLGFGRAVNFGADAGSAPWIVAANSDVEIEDGALEALIAAGQAHEDAGAVAPRLLLPDGSTQHSVHRFPSPSLAALAGAGLDRISGRVGRRLLLEGSWDPGVRAEVDWAHGALVAFRRAAFEQVGGFDPRQWMYAEDLDICWRLQREGYTVRYEPDARVGHELSAATRQAFTDRDRRHLAAAYVWLARRRGRGIAAVTAGLNLLTAWLRVGIHAAASLVRGDGHREGLARARRFARLHPRAFRDSLRPERR